MTWGEALPILGAGVAMGWAGGIAVLLIWIALGSRR